MKKNLRKFFFLSLMLSAFSAIAQQEADHFVYAVTSLKKEGTDWISLRKLNTQTTQFSTIVLNGTDKSWPIYDAFTMSRLEDFLNDTIANSNPQLAFGSGVAALAYDKSTNRLFYTPMLVDQLRYVDLNTMKIYGVSGQSFGKTGNFQFYAGAISRMVITPDGYGYTITNDGDHLFRFNTSGNITITDLGAITDAATNKETIHNPCGNAGGDLIADDENNLYLVTASNHVFKTNINTRTTQYLGTILGLPQKFTSNGAAVDEDGNIVVSSSMYTDSYFSVDPKTWAATPYKPMTEMYSSADLANSNVLHTSPASLVKSNANSSNKIKAYPNPVANNAFNVQFNNLTTGNYSIQLTDEFGSELLHKKIRVALTSQTETISISGYDAQGFYLLRVLDESNKTIFR